MTLPDPEQWPTAASLGDSSADLLRLRADSTPDRTALVDADRGETWTYDEFDRRVDRTAAALAEIEPDAGRVAFLLDTRPAFAAAYFAVARRGGTVVPLNVRLATDTLATQVDRAGVDAVICESETAETARAVAPDGASVVSVGSIESRGADAADIRDAATDGDRLVMFTSGTTGQPKGVRLTRDNLVASAVGSAYRLGVEADDRWLVCLPMYHMGGLAPLVRSTLSGTTTVVLRSFDAEATAAAVDDYGITGVSLVPTMLTRLLDAGWRPSKSLRFVLLGGAPASPDLVERALDRGVPVYPTYGLTETASQVATATPADLEDDSDTVGRPLRGTAVTVLGDDGGVCDPGETGELVVDGPTVTPGYLDDEQTAAAFDDRGFHTGDLGYADDDGRLWVVGRVDDAIVTGGENVHPARVADALRDCAGVADAAVVGLPDEEWGERVAALVVSENTSLTAETVRDRVGDRLADFAVPKTVALADSLPRTASGTVDRAAVRERLRSERDE